MTFTKNNLRKFQARDLLQNFDSWLAQKLQTESLQVEYVANGPIKVIHNQRLVSHQTHDKFSISHDQHNQIEIHIDNHQFERFYIDNFDCLGLLDFKNGLASLIFEKPFVLWYTDQTYQKKPAKVLSDRVLYEAQAEPMVQEILRKLPKLKY